MARLTIVWLMLLATVVVGVIVWGVLTLNTDAKMVGALGGVLLTLVAKGISAIKHRNGRTGYDSE
jgi:hypothetical protein